MQASCHKAMAPWAAVTSTRRYLDDVPVDKVQQFEADLLHYAQQHHPELKKEIASIGKIDDKVGGRLKEILAAFKQKMGYGAKP